ncbi:MULTISPECIES: pyridoxal-phosphate dependent enzyme [Pedobacter]|jgi:cystathionine beta-synthase|uniref:Cystathionine beta-synthase n=2 Tax=Pedobacter TaxID=84567 RepID=A0A0T5VNJ3_9SPHI|nr:MULTISPECIES: pyridoxal-phosphate dependent enzyme [Pedobacter]MDQ0967061.1 cystathionine beta-synthase [Flavobacterium sp. W4I14]KRT15454.1 cystathionine beta-synthase [Pedobacter ginsenosidimutans]TBO43461.1 pyridoxal-phosphate dependent enzyme [Pedobacter kyonggii]CAH0143251.1 Putative cystathionine beta-synthase Rv1077 [Pedobacter sp. Bi126]CAH0143669.1 Putative cystathionine beta-synthase Rv1077 [Pedobacter sp. Bi27]
MWYNNILETIGNTPLVKLNTITKGVPGTILAKIETTNPGNSIKDRMAVKMIEDAEKSGKLKPGGTIIEGTSGNTGMGLAMAAIIKGYKCIFTTTDKQSKEKVDALRAFGAEVIVCPTNVEPEDPRSYYSVSSRLEREVPNSWKPNQYDNLANSQAHYEQTGPEIWEQTEGKITHLVVGVGTGGTISGTGKYLKEKNPNIKVWGIDTYGSVFKKYKETGIFDKDEIYPYITEGIGEDFLPANVNFDVIDLFEKVTDKDAALMTRDIARKEGIFVGNSAGAAIGGLIQLKDKLKPEDVVVVIFHDHGSRYMGKMYNEDWLRERGFLQDEKLTAKSILAKKESTEIVTLDAQKSVLEAINTIKSMNISQIPVTQQGMIVGKIAESDILSALLENPGLKSAPISEIMTATFPFVDLNTSIDKISSLINKENSAVLVEDESGKIEIITQYDIINAISG